MKWPSPSGARAAPPAPVPASYRWFPGYTVAFVAGLSLLASAPGQTFVVSQFNTSLREAFGIGALTLNAAYTVATVAAAFPLVWVGRVTDAIGPRRMLTLVGLAFGLSAVFMASVTGAIGVFVGFFLLRLLGQGALTLVSQHAVAMWFHRRLGTVHGAKQVAVFALWVGTPQLTIALIERVGWRQTYVLFAVAIWVLVVPAAWFLVRDRPEDLGLTLDGDPEPSPEARAAAVLEPEATLAEARRTRAFWAVVSATFLSPLIGTAILFDMQPLLVSRGLSAADGAAVISAWTATTGLMALPSGLLTDRFAPRRLLSLGMALIGAGCAILVVIQSTLAGAAAMVVVGVGQSLVGTCGVATLARYYGRRHHGAIRSAATRFGVIGTGLGPLFTGLSAHWTDEYAASLWVFAALCVPVVALVATLHPPPRAAR